MNLVNELSKVYQKFGNLELFIGANNDLIPFDFERLKIEECNSKKVLVFDSKQEVKSTTN